MNATFESALLEKSEKKQDRVDKDYIFAIVGFAMLILFIVLTTVMALSLLLFTIGFLMAVTHWYDRYLAVYSLCTGWPKK